MPNQNQLSNSKTENHQKTNANKKSSVAMLLLGVFYPAGVIGFELVTRMCAKNLFNPIPTIWHVLLVSLVPAANGFIWWRLSGALNQHTRLLAFLGATAIGVAAFYTLLFLPIFPMAAFAVVFYGIGLLPLAPLVSLITASLLYKRLRKREPTKMESQKSPLWKGLAVAFGLLILLELPTIVTKTGIRWATAPSAEVNRRGVQLLRRFGDEDALLRYCYSRTGLAGGPWNLIASLLHINGRHIPTPKIREVFYRVTGEPFNSRPSPYDGGTWQILNDFQFDWNQGGTQVGSRIRDLHLLSSRIDGSVDGDSALAYLEWTMTFRNNATRAHEARAQIALPPGAVVSRATLWVNGEEREAAFAGRAQVRRAYESVVRRRQDPLLVTTQGPERILAQAFPVPPNGGTLRYRIGITAPLDLANLDEGRLVLPTFVSQNFNLRDDFRHALWIEGKQPLETSTRLALHSRRVAHDHYRLSREIRDKELASPSAFITVARDASINTTWTLDPVNEGEFAIVQTIVETTPEVPDGLVIVLDGSALVKPSVQDIIEGLNAIPSGVEVGFIIASDTLAQIQPSAWNENQKRRIVEMLRKHRLVGGQNNAPGLASAMQILEAYDPGTLLWIHGPQPVPFENTHATLNQAIARLVRFPDIALLSVAAGPNRLLNQAEWAMEATVIPRLGDVKADLHRYFEKIDGKQATFEIKRKRIPVYEVDQKLFSNPRSRHITPLWAKEEVLHTLGTDAAGNRSEAIQLASRYHIITPVSGAVVLETAQQYEANSLTPVDRDSVPTIPEPEVWALLIIALLFIIWFTLRHQNHHVSARASSGISA